MASIIVTVPKEFTNFKCISCDLTWLQIFQETGRFPKTHTNFGRKSDPHELCGSCWYRIKKERQTATKPVETIEKKKFVCASCNRDSKELEKLAREHPYYREKRRLKGESKFVPARYCLPCRMKIDRSERKANQSPPLPLSSSSEETYQ